VVPVDPGWDDIGDFDSLAGLLGGDVASPTVLGDPGLVRAIAASGLVVPASGRLVSVVGLEDVVVVDTPDALLVTTRERAQQVKDVVATLRAGGREDLV
jgi:mannose-1-phosphate guanylyltransferase